MNNRIGIGILAFVLTMLFHGGALYYLQHLDMTFFSTSTGQIENLKPMEASESVAKEEELKNRTRELAVIFNNVTQPVEEQINYLDDAIEFNKNSFESAELTPPEAYLNVPEEEPNLLPSINLQDIVDPRNSNEKAHEFALLNNDFLLDEIIDTLVAETDQLQGHVLTYPTENIQTDARIQIGSQESISLEGNTLENNQQLLIPTVYVDEAAEFASLAAFDLYQSFQGSKPVRSDTTPFNPLIKGNAKKHSEKDLLPNSNTFDTHIALTPANGSSEYFFKATFYPKNGIRFKRITQNYFFLIDRSHSIRPKRYEFTKKAVSEALGYIHESDTFNILVFDDRVISLFPKNVPATRENVAYARHLIQAQKYGGVFTTTDLYSSLGRIIPKRMPEQEVSTAILLSDGDTFLSRDKQRETIAAWTQRNEGKVSLYALPTGGGNNLPLLGLLSNLNKGSLFHAPKDRDAENTLVSLIRQIQHPIGKDLVATAIISKPGMQVQLYPTSRRLPNLYENTPYTIYGSTNSLDNFYLFIQGRFYDDLLDIKSHIDFSKAVLVTDGSIERQVAQQRAYGCYENYLHDGRKIHLQTAKKLLTPYRTAIPFL